MTEPYASSMMNRGSGIDSYNVHMTVDIQRQLIVAQAVSTVANSA
jgi:hypothetical protein